MNSKAKIAIATAGFIFLLVFMAALFMVSHGKVEAAGFCDFCHTQYYDGEEYAFNENVGMEKPKGVLVGCAECHPQPYSEFKGSMHFDTEYEDKRPGCTNCHEPHSFFQWLKYMYFSPDSWERVQLSLHDNTFWEGEARPDLAIKARKSFVVNKSRPCKKCHLPPDFKEEVKPHAEAIKKAEGNVEKVRCKKCHLPVFTLKKKAHNKALEEAGGSFEEVLCIACHYNFVHAEAPWDNKKEDIEAWLKEAE